MNGHLRRCQSVLRAHVRLSTLRAQGLLPPSIWRIPEQAPRGFAPRSQRNIKSRVRAFAATKTACLALGLVFVMRLAATAQVSPPAASDAAAVVAADIEQTVLTPDGRATTTTTKLYLADAKARLEPENGSGRAGYAEFHLYDFERKRFYRVFPDDRIYFDIELSTPLAVRAFVEGWAPQPPEVTVRSIPLKDDDLDGVPARLALVERRVGKHPTPDYALVWTAVAPRRLPLRVMYMQEGSRTVIVSYRNVESQAFDPGRFSIPEGFSNLSPF